MRTIKVIIITAMLIFGAFSLAFSYDLTGTWEVTVKFTRDQPQVGNVLIVQTGETFTYEGIPGRISNGKYKIPGPFPGRFPMQGIWLQLDRLEFTPKDDNNFNGKLDIAIFDYEKSTNKVMSTDADVSAKRVMDQPPLIRMLGAGELWIKTGDEYNDSGAKALTGMGVDITDRMVVASNVDMKKAGDYKITYNVSDDKGKAAKELARTIHVVSPAPPVITLNGEKTVNLKRGDTFKDVGAKALNYLHKDISDKVTTLVNGAAADPSSINTQKSGKSFTIAYLVEDENGKAQVERTVTIIKGEDEKSLFAYCFISNLTGGF